MTDRSSLYAALILPESTDRDTKRCLDAAYRVLSRCDAPADGTPFRNPQRGSVHGQHFAVQVRHEEQSAYGPRLVVTVTDRSGPVGQTAADILSDVVLDTLRRSAADIIEWTDPKTLIDRDEFIALRSYVSPRRPRPDVAQEAASLGLDPADRATARLPGWAARWLETRAPQTAAQSRSRTVVWAVTALVATVSLPAATALLVLGLVRGATRTLP